MVDVVGQFDTRWRADLTRALGVLVGCVLAGAPAGLLWAAIAPRLVLTITDNGPQADNLESTKAFIGADGSFLLVALALGIVCGAAAYFLASWSGPWTVMALAIGGVLGALIQAKVGLMPGTKEAIEALQPGTDVRGKVELFLGARSGNSVNLRSPSAGLAWPVGALATYLFFSLRADDQEN